MGGLVTLSGIRNVGAAFGSPPCAGLALSAVSARMEGVDQFDPAILKISHVPRYEHEAAHSGDGGSLVIRYIHRAGHSPAQSHDLVLGSGSRTIESCRATSQCQLSPKGIFLTNGFQTGCSRRVLLPLVRPYGRRHTAHRCAPRSARRCGERQSALQAPHIPVPSGDC